MPPFPAMYSVLSNQSLIEQVLSNYALEPPVNCRLLQQGGSDTYLVSAGTQRWILRITISGGSIAGHTEDAELLLKLATCRVPIARPIQRCDGSYVQELAALEGPRFATLFEFAHGTPPGKAITPAQSFTYGQAVARMHTCFDTLPQTSQRWRFDLTTMLDKPLLFWERLLNGRPGDVSYLRSLVPQLKQALEILVAEVPPLFGLCHGDLHKTNLLVTPEGGLTLIDFDGPLSYRAYDLAVLFWSMRDLPQAEAVCEAYLGGYTTLRHLSEPERAAIPYFVAARHIWINTVEIERATNGYTATGWIDDAHFDQFFDFLKRWVRDRCHLE
ncbi:MAG: phosphotransferase [Roseiflexaceae bacterium]|nr:phosphotransferase [Roseiflexaceae bacterium]